MKAGVQHRRMKHVPGGHCADLFGSLDLDQHLGSCPPQALHLSECGAELITTPFEVPTILIPIEGLAQLRPETVDHGAGRISADHARQVALGMEIPAAFTWSGAEDREALVFRVEHSLED